MKLGTNALRAAVAALVIAGGVGSLTPAFAADGAEIRGYVTDGFDRPVSDGVDNCVGDGFLPEGAARKCAVDAPAPVAEPKMNDSTSEA